MRAPLRSLTLKLYITFKNYVFLFYARMHCIVFVQIFLVKQCKADSFSVMRRGSDIKADTFIFHYSILQIHEIASSR